MSPFDGFNTMVTALMISCLAGWERDGGVVASMLIGILETLTVAYLSVTLRDIVFILVGIVLLVRPQGLFGRNAGVLERV